MSNLNYYNIQKAIYEKLTGDSQLMVIISGLFDYPPQSAVFPFVSLGNIRSFEIPSLVGGTVEHQCDINIYSREAGHKQTAGIMEIIYRLLHNRTISVSGKNFVMMHIDSNSIQLEDDGWTYRGFMHLNIVLQDG